MSEETHPHTSPPAPEETAKEVAPSNETPPSPEEAPQDDPSAPNDLFPFWLQTLLTRADDLPGLSAQVSLWVPTLLAAFNAGQSALRLSQALSQSLQTPDDGLQWPDEASAELVYSLGELFDAFPSFEALLPALSELVDLGSTLLDEDHTRALGQRSLAALENLGNRLLKSIIDLAFFSRGLARKERPAEWQLFFGKLEDIFDRTLEIWLHTDATEPDRPTPDSATPDSATPDSSMKEEPR